MESLLTRRSRAGVVYVEFLIVFWPMMLLWLALAQIGLIYGAHIAVHHAAARAARAAIVILPDERDGWEDRYESDPVLTIGTGNGLSAYESARTGGRLDAIRRAARLTLAPISPGLGFDAGSVIAGLVGYMWTEYAVAVIFPDNDGTYRTAFNQTGPLTTRVTYLYKCSVPVVNKLICHNYWGADSFISDDIRRALEKAGELAGVKGSIDSGIDPAVQKELATVDAEILGAAGLGFELASVGFEIGGGGWQFLALRAERTLPMQGRHQ
ncbi:MAG: hypothetical protein GY847_16040 [Proteobacteria bacterium]|nr:hypothetical protein [Pseudomonadota bacterium]